jgi:hypothetical protein
MQSTSAGPVGSRDAWVREKLIAFERLRPEFVEAFAFVAAVQGQQRYVEFPIDATVRYLHALWICDCKDRLLGVPRATARYEGRRCLLLLRGWQQGETTAVVAFLQRRLDLLDFAAVMRERDDALRAGDLALAARLAHGRRVLLNRGLNLHYALDAIFALADDELLEHVRATCRRYGHAPEQIEAQLASLEMPLYAYRRHPELARHNMLTMNALGIQVTDNPADLPGHRTWKVEASTMPISSYAQETIAHERTLVGMGDNYPRGRDLANSPVQVDMAGPEQPRVPPV